MVKANEDCATGNGAFYLDGKRFFGFDAQEYLREQCGFSNSEAIAYLTMLALAEQQG